MYGAIDSSGTPAKVEGTMEKGLLKLTIPKRAPIPEERMTKLKLK
ncbi:MAG: hypothetical protein ACXW02_05495 [Halobacteriota archaeon]|jgi:hypothetical protein